MTANNNSNNNAAVWQARWLVFSATAVRWYHAYAQWLISISWKRFFVIALIALIVMGILHDKPPLTWSFTEQIESDSPRTVVITQRASKAPTPPTPPTPPTAATPPTPAAPPSTISKGPIHIETPGKGEGVEINIGKNGISITPKTNKGADGNPQSAAEKAQADAQRAERSAERSTEAAAQKAETEADKSTELSADKILKSLKIVVPPGASAEAIREALEAAKKQIADDLKQAHENAQEAVAEAKRDAEQARLDAQETVEEIKRELGRSRSSTRTTRIGIGDVLMQFTTLFVAVSAIIKLTYKGRMQAEVKAAQATETAEAESLKRQVVEARMAAMQAQVEPHFLFNTLASIDHLIETDPARASVMQKNLIALLRASMPTMREANGAGAGGGERDLGRELAVIRPYLEILKVRMEERLATDVQVPDGLLSAAFPPMMIQTLVENAIKHGLEPKPEGGSLRLKAEIVHGKLQVTVADTGLGFGKAATAGTGVGLANIRERLQLLYGSKASLTVAENQPSGTVVTVTVPYKTVDEAMGTAAGAMA
jgi:Histidine kinase